LLLAVIVTSGEFPNIITCWLLSRWVNLLVLKNSWLLLLQVDILILLLAYDLTLLHGMFQYKQVFTSRWG
jgi:hypothetical protein